MKLILCILFAVYTLASAEEDTRSGASISFKNKIQFTRDPAWGTPEKKILIVYYSQGQNTGYIAETLAGLLGADLERLTTRNGKKPSIISASFGLEQAINDLQKNPADYDLVIIGNPVWSWNIIPPVRAFLKTYGPAIKSAAYFTVAGGTEPDKIVKKMEAVCGKSAVSFTGINDADFQEKS
ncbi:MAG TPA: hypothetical protein DC049_18025, partial [Spirochaetia bacterium]|nr:hypothetical protein [Spirochaetia bacterium]